MTDINKLAEIMQKESGNIQVHCMSERESVETAPYASRSYHLLDPCFYNEKINNDWNEQRSNITSYSDILEFIDKHRPSFFGKIRYCQPYFDAFSYKDFREYVKCEEKDYRRWCEKYSSIANQLKEELNEQTIQNVRLTYNRKFDFNELELLTTDEDGLINPVTIKISDILFSTQSKEVLVRLFPQPLYATDACCDIQFPAEYYKSLNWEE